MQLPRDRSKQLTRDELGDALVPGEATMGRIF